MTVRIWTLNHLFAFIFTIGTIAIIFCINFNPLIMKSYWVLLVCLFYILKIPIIEYSQGPQFNYERFHILACSYEPSYEPIGRWTLICCSYKIRDQQLPINA